MIDTARGLASSLYSDLPLMSYLFIFLLALIYLYSKLVFGSSFKFFLKHILTGVYWCLKCAEEGLLNPTSVGLIFNLIINPASSSPYFSLFQLFQLFRNVWNIYIYTYIYTYTYMLIFVCIKMHLFGVPG